MAKPKKVSVVIPNYNGLVLLKKNLPSVVKAANFKKNNICEVIVVDDCSSDSSVDFIQKSFSEIRLIKHTKNRGFASAVNTGARSSKGDLIALLNSDVSVQSNFLASTITHFNDRNIFAVSLHEKGYGWAKGVFKDGFIQHNPGKEEKKSCQTFWVSGGSGVFRRDYWMKLGGMDETLYPPFYWEDVDISYRALKRGLKLIWEPNSFIVHKHESTIKRYSKRYRRRIQQRNQLLFIWKNLTSPILFRKHKIGLLKRIARHPGYIKIVFFALLKLAAIRKARKKEIRETKVSDEAIFASFS